MGCQTAIQISTKKKQEKLTAQVIVPVLKITLANYTDYIIQQGF